jgi:hypothetical protein
MVRGMGKVPPDANDLWAKVTAQDKRRISAWNRHPESTLNNPIVNRFEYAEITKDTDIESPMSAIPLASSRGEFSAPVYEVVPFFGYGLEDENAPSMEYYSYDESGYEYNNLATIDHEDESPAPITLVPTSSTNPDRPRTVAAGYDFAETKLTVIFRDGTYYNYFEVPNLMWQNFKRARSKGRFILKYLDDKPRGRADVSTVPAFARQAVYRFLRTGQSFRGGYQPGQSPKSRRGLKRY